MVVTANVVAIVGEIIREVKDVPSGHLYSVLMGHGMDIHQYNEVIAILTDIRCIRVSNHLITWTGPAAQ